MRTLGGGVYRGIIFNIFISANPSVSFADSSPTGEPLWRCVKHIMITNWSLNDLAFSMALPNKVTLSIILGGFYFAESTVISGIRFSANTS